MAKRNITYLTDALLITCVIQKDQAEQVLEAAKNAGAQGATISYAQGTGIRERMGLIGVTIDEQKEVIRILNNAFNYIDNTYNVLLGAENRAEALKQSILKQTFSGYELLEDAS